MTFKALLATKTDNRISVSVVDLHEQDLMPGDVTVKIDYSTVNYKDALALSGYADVIKQFPLIAGIDFAGTVEASAYPGIAVGNSVVANGWGLRPDPSRRICSEGTCERRVAGQKLRTFFRPGTQWRLVRLATRRCSLYWRLNMVALHRLVETFSSLAPMAVWAQSRLPFSPVLVIAWSRRPAVSRNKII